MNIIANVLRDAEDGRTYRRLNPARLVDVVGDFPDSGAEIAAEAVQAAALAFPGWDATSLVDRAGYLTRTATVLRSRAAEIGAAMTREEGKPIARATGEVVRAAETLEYFAGTALTPVGITAASLRPHVRLETRRQSLGPVLAITPFNFPVFLTAMKLGPALLWGNTVVWKPSPYVPVTSRLVMDAFLEADLPRGVVNLVLGAGPDLGSHLVEDDRIRAISFTGSTRVGLEIGRRAAGRHVRIQQEMGGKNVLAVAPDVPMRAAAGIAAESAFGESGQKCTAAGVVVVPRSHYDDFMAGIEAELSEAVVGDGADPEVTIGPLIDDASLTRVRQMVERSAAQGAEVVLAGAGSTRVDLDSGHFYEPQVVRLPEVPTCLQTEETFAPILSVRAAEDPVGTALELIRSSGMGLSASILTHDVRSAERFAASAEAGLVGVNLPTTGVEFHVPFGGWNDSGGPFPEAGTSARDFWTRTKTVAVQVAGV